MEYTLWSPAIVIVAFVAVVLLTLSCLQCRSILFLRKAKQDEDTNISDEDFVIVECPSDPSPPSYGDVDKDNGTLVTPEISVTVQGEVEMNAPAVHAEQPKCIQYSEPSPQKPELFEQHSELSDEGKHERKDSVLSLGEDPPPSICGTLDFCRQSYGYISPNAKFRPLAALQQEVVSQEHGTRNTEMFFDAESSPSGLDTIALWRREIENMTNFSSDFSATLGARFSVLSKSYDASSEDSYNTAVESSGSAAEAETQAMCKKSTRKRLLSRKSRSIQRIPSFMKDSMERVRYSVLWGINSPRLCREKSDALSLPKPVTSEFQSDEDEADPQSPTSDALRGPRCRPKPAVRLKRHGVYGGSFKDKQRQGPLEAKVNTLDTCLPKDDAFIGRPESVSSADLHPPPRARSHPNIFLRSIPRESRGESTNGKRDVLPSLTLWCPPSSTGVKVTMNVSHKSGRKTRPKACSAPPEVEYVNFKGSMKR